MRALSVRFGILAQIGALFGSLGGCARGELDGPPELRAGRDECAECGMIITDERASAALIIEVGGRREHRLFDDLGCLVDFRHAPREGWTEVKGYAANYAEGGWIDLASAHFLLAETRRLMTPMGSGYVAFADDVQAQNAHAAFGGRVASFDGLCEARRTWRETIHSGSHHQEIDNDG